MLSKRTRLSLAQYLALQEQGLVGLLLEKHGIDSLAVRFTTEFLQELATSLQDATNQQLRSLLDEIGRTQGDLRTGVNPKYRYEERFHDLQACLELDGQVFEDGRLVPLDPSIAETPPVEDDLTSEIRASGLPEAGAIIQKLEDSAQAFRSVSVNYNACLNDSRVALQSLATSIARARSATYPHLFDPTKWGSVLAHFRSTRFITDEEERGLAGVFGFVSPGSHRPLGLSDQEFARLGRSFVLGMCWFLIKQFRAMPRISPHS